MAVAEDVSFDRDWLAHNPLGRMTTVIDLRGDSLYHDPARRGGELRHWDRI
jgi:hypothetical protein